jgi:predicted transcriptional regulator
MSANAEGKRRLRVQIYIDVLRALNSAQKSGQSPRLYRVEQAARLTYPRLRDCLDELRDAGFVGTALEVTSRGYDFLQEFSTKVIPVMVRYGLWRDRL